MTHIIEAGRESVDPLEELARHERADLLGIIATRKGIAVDLSGCTDFENDRSFQLFNQVVANLGPLCEHGFDVRVGFDPEAEDRLMGYITPPETDGIRDSITL